MLNTRINIKANFELILFFNIYVKKHRYLLVLSEKGFNNFNNKITRLISLKGYVDDCKNIIPKIDLSILKKSSRENAYRILGDTVDIGQGCTFVGNSNQKLKSYGFDTCAPFIMLTNKGGKHVLGHIDALSKPQEIVEKLKTHFAPKEIENTSFHYFEGADTLAPG